MIFSLFKKLKISYGITVCNEAKELEALLSCLVPLIDENDEIIILQDVTNKDENVSNVVKKFAGLRVIEAKLNNDFSTFKNNLLASAKGDYLFQIDADEIPSPALIKGIKKVIKRKMRCDCFWVPRINFVNGYTSEHVRKWNWQIDSKQRINYPDYQSRIIKLNGRIKWQNKVHEVFTGYKRVFYLPSETEDFCLIHIKDILKQEKQNDFYDKLTPVDQPSTNNS